MKGCSFLGKTLIAHEINIFTMIYILEDDLVSIALIYYIISELIL